MDKELATRAGLTAAGLPVEVPDNTEALDWALLPVRKHMSRPPLTAVDDLA